MSAPARPDPRIALYRRLYGAALFVVGVTFVGAFVFHLLGQGRWDWPDCLYMTVVTLSTVGFAEMLPGMDITPFARAWTVLLIVLGSGSLLYFASTVTAILIEGDLQGILRMRGMQRRIDKLKNHVVVCGVGSTGVHVVEELIASDVPCVVVDKDAARLQRVREALGSEMLYVSGDVTDDATLLQAGIGRARGVLVALHDDKDNIFTTITARALNADARIVAKAVEHNADEKLRRAGANSVVSPNYIGGVRMAGEMVRPSVVQFLDRMIRDQEMTLRIEEIKIPSASQLVGCSLANSEIRDLGNALVLAARQPDGSYHYNPSSDFVILAGTTLIVIAQMQDVTRLRQHLVGPVAPV